MSTTLGVFARRIPRLRRIVEERDALRREVQALRSASGRSDLDYVFVVTYGRSGSTLLQGILNSIPGWLIRGENNNAVYWLWKHYHAIDQVPHSRRRGELSDQTDPWFGLDRYPREIAIERIRQLVLETILRPEPDTRVTGFKEIRWRGPDLTDYLRFLQVVFPGARFVFNTRNLTDVANSAWFTENPAALATLQSWEADQAAAAEILGDSGYRVSYDEYTSDPLVLRGLFEWLGEPFDEQRIRAVLATPHSFASKGRAQPSS